MEVQDVLSRLANEPIVKPVDDRSQDFAVRSRSADAERVSGNSEDGDVVEYLHYDEAEKTFSLEMVQDVEPVLDNVKELRNNGGNDAGKNKAGDFYLAGSFPQIIVYAWLKLRGLTQRDFKGQVVRDFLNDSEHAAFRVWPGRV
jgi:hypothetical protein